MKQLLRRFLRFVPILALGCSDPVEPCSKEALARLEAQYFAELYATCQGKPSIVECPDAEPVIAKYASLREEWVQCR